MTLDQSAGCTRQTSIFRRLCFRNCEVSQTLGARSSSFHYIMCQWDQCQSSQWPVLEIQSSRKAEQRLRPLATIAAGLPVFQRVDNDHNWSCFALDKTFVSSEWEEQWLLISALANLLTCKVNTVNRIHWKSLDCVRSWWFGALPWKKGVWIYSDMHLGAAFLEINPYQRNTSRRIMLSFLECRSRNCLKSLELFFRSSQSKLINDWNHCVNVPENGTKGGTGPRWSALLTYVQENSPLPPKE